MERSIHIVTVALDDVSRILPINMLPPISEIYLVTGIRSSDSGRPVEKPRVYESLIRDIKRAVKGVSFKEFEVPFYDLQGAFAKTLEIIREAKRNADKVYVNIASTSKILALAFYIAACVEDVPIYLVQPKHYIYPAFGKVDRILKSKRPALEKVNRARALLNYDKFRYSYGAEAVIFLPRVLHPELPASEVEVVDALLRFGGRVDAEERVVSFLANKNRVQVTRQSLLNKVSRTVLALESKGIITKTRQGRNAAIALTEVGQIVALAAVPASVKRR
ncbi:hypothetical protein HYS54_04945 [Candidatus Micrarchaeota archaeon]|nr:hypothetical protein [Candidatus Micrarchaeota archaeon]